MRVIRHQRQTAANGAPCGSAPAGHRPSASPGTPVRSGVWCETLVAVCGSDAVERRDVFAAPSPEAAIAWMRLSARSALPMLGPLQAGYVLDRWVHGSGSLEDFARLSRGRPCSLSVYRGDLRLTWQAHPVRFLHIAPAGGPRPEGGAGAHRRPRLRLVPGGSHAV